MAIAVYNPKYYKKGLEEEKVRNEANIKGFVWSHARWDLKVNEMKKFPDDVGEALLRHAGFLIKVDHKNIKKIREEMTEKEYKCKYCTFETTDRVKLMNHVRNEHKLSKEDKDMLAGIDRAKASEEYLGVAGKKKPKGISPADIERQEGISDKEGFYGPGYEKDTLAGMKKSIPGKTPGHFGG